MKRKSLAGQFILDNSRLLGAMWALGLGACAHLIEKPSVIPLLALALLVGLHKLLWDIWKREFDGEATLFPLATFKFTAMTVLFVMLTAFLALPQLTFPLLGAVLIGVAIGIGLVRSHN